MPLFRWIFAIPVMLGLVLCHPVHLEHIRHHIQPMAGQEVVQSSVPPVSQSPPVVTTTTAAPPVVSPPVTVPATPPPSNPTPTTAEVAVPAVVAPATTAATDPVTTTERAAWERVAICETGGDWTMEGPVYSGALGMRNTVWIAYGGTQFAPNAGEATEDQQIQIAERVNSTGFVPDQNGCAGSW